MECSAFFSSVSKASIHPGSGTVFVVWRRLSLSYRSCYSRTVSFVGSIVCLISGCAVLRLCWPTLRRKCLGGPKAENPVQHTSTEAVRATGKRSSLVGGRWSVYEEGLCWKVRSCAQKIPWCEETRRRDKGEQRPIVVMAKRRHRFRMGPVTFLKDEMGLGRWRCVANRILMGRGKLNCFVC